WRGGAVRAGGAAAAPGPPPRHRAGGGRVLARAAQPGRRGGRGAPPGGRPPARGGAHEPRPRAAPMSVARELVGPLPLVARRAAGRREDRKVLPGGERGYGRGARGLWQRSGPSCWFAGGAGSELG